MGFIDNCRKRTKRTGPLTVDEIRRTFVIWIQDAQRQKCANVIDELQGQANSKPQSIIRQLKLYMDKDNLVRCRGRIQNAPVSETTKYLLLLPANKGETIHRISGFFNSISSVRFSILKFRISNRFGLGVYYTVSLPNALFPMVKT